MERYFFNLSVGPCVVRDEIGEEFSDMDRVTDRALMVASEIARNSPAMDDVVLSVVSESGTPVFEVPLSAEPLWELELLNHRVSAAP